LEVQYRQLFLRDLKKLKKQSVYQQIVELAFEILPNTEDLRSLSNVKALKGYPNQYRIRIGDYRVGIEVNRGKVEMMRVLH
jgi:mRNA-degrading endonuclease RelE of RelBE toxin-antitoxin system